jgi:glycosyltransferase involved in cell wall biosynthesis
MRSNGIWSKYDPRYLAQRRWERLIKGQAETLVAVSESYAAHLVRNEELSADKVRTVPCWVDFNKFKPCAGSRAAVRKKLNAEKALICVYVGKFGGMYYEREAARTLELMHEVIGDRLFVMILSPDGKEKISGLFRENSPIIERLWIGSVRHDEVPMYLSGADFAVSFHRTSPWSFAYSPIKHAEYWAMGLPTIIPAGVGDEARWIEEKRVGAVMNVGDEDSVREATRSVISLLADESHRSQIRDVAIRLRGRERLETVYGSILGGYRNQ